MRFSTGTIIIVGLSLAGAVNAADFGTTRQSIDIPAQELGSALQTLAAERSFQVVFAAKDIDRLRTKGARGVLTSEDALAKLLHGTGFTFEKLGDDGVMIVPVATGSNAAKATTPKKSSFQMAQSEDAENQPAGQETPRADGGVAPMGQVQEIIVTAQKRQERLQDVPISISVLDGAQLDRSTDRGIAEALTRVPGVSNQISTGAARTGSSGGVVVIRGVAAASGISPTAYYLDGVPFGFSRPTPGTLSPDMNAYDMERVEVLRGPQGTLYGSSALNGVVRVLTKDANLDEFELKGRTGLSSTESGGENYRGDVAISVPIIDGKLAIRGVMGYQYLDGWIDKPTEDDANDSTIRTYRLKINAQPTEQLSIGAFAWLSRTDTGAPSNSADNKISLSAVDEPSLVDYDIYGLTAEYDFSAFSVTSATSYMDYKNNPSFDFAPFTVSSVLLNANFGAEVFSEEVNISSTHEGPWRWSAGGIYRDVKDFQLLERRLPTGALASPYLAPDASQGYSESFAVFGELTRAFLDGQWELTLGLRYFEDEVRQRETSRRQCIGGTPAPGNCTGGAAFEVPLTTGSDQFDNVTPRAVLTWHVNDELTTYASYGEGFRSGFNQTFTALQVVPGLTGVQPDSLENYEIGAKGSLMDGRIAFETAVYYIDWQDVQVARGVDITAPGGLQFGILVFDNAGIARGPGFDLGVTAEPMKGLTLGINGSWNGLEVDDDLTSQTAAGPVVLYPKGIRLPNSAEYTLGLTADYEFPLGGSGLTGRLSASGNYLSDVITTNTNPTVTTPAAPNTIVDGYWVTRASFGVRGARGWGGSLYVDNLTDQDAVSRDPSSPRWNTWLRPRTIGLQIEFKH